MELSLHEDVKSADSFAQRGGECPIPGGIQGQTRQGSEQPDAPVQWRTVGLDDL